VLENVWLIPAIPFVSFWLILAVGKRLGERGTQAIGISALAIAFVLSCVAGYQWIDRAQAAEDGVLEPIVIVQNGDKEEIEPEPVAHGEGAEGDHGESEEDAHAEEGAEAEGDHAEDDAGSPVETAEDQLAADEAEHAEEEPTAAEEEEGGHTEEAGAAGPVIQRVTWFQWGGTEFYAGTMIDGLAAMMLFTVTLISLLVHIYSTEYLKGDRRHTHYFAFLSLFTSAMLFYVVSENILQMLVGWELVGVCSFVLIGHWWEEKKNSDAALKAFLTNRVGDVGLLIGVVILFFAVGGNFSVLGINASAASGEVSHTLLLVGSLCLFWGVTSKSGQFPLHTWLPDAMAGPTPVSALIHAATMVVAGVYLIARLYPVFFEGLSIQTGTLNYVAVIGGVTTLVGASLAFVQKDIKKVLAYSTISQLGYMVMALGVGAWTAAVFHVFTHAFFKAGLFLGAGSVSHAAHHTFDMREMGGLKKYMPQTFWTFVICSFALAGIFPLAGFWSKDEILAGAAAGQGGGAYSVMLAMGLITALLTAAYMTRCVYLTFFGEYRGHGTPHESPKVMTVPLWILSGFAVLAGLANIPADFAPDSLAHRFQTWVEPTTSFAPVEHAEFEFWLAGLSLGLALLGIAIGYAYYFRNLGPHGLTERNALARSGYTLLDNRYYLDHLYTDIIVGRIKGPIARAANWFNQKVIDGVVNGVGVSARAAGQFTYDVVDQKVVDNVVNGTGVASDEAGQELRKIQTGKVQQYAALMFGGAIVLAAFFIVLV
jgi:NADH-quinone oxidoreductase subunit L